MILLKTKNYYLLKLQVYTLNSGLVPVDAETTDPYILLFTFTLSYQRQTATNTAIPQTKFSIKTITTVSTSF